MQNAAILAVQLIVFCIVVAAALVSMRSFESFIAVRRRLAQPATVERGASLIRNEKINSPILIWIQSAFLSSDVDRVRLRTDLIQAGIEQPAAPTLYVAIRFSLAIALPFLFIIGGIVSGHPATGLAAVIAPVALAIIGFGTPRLFLNMRRNARRVQIENQFPDALDLMVVCVEAGLGLEAAFMRVGQETARSHPQISQEFARLNDELAAGRSRADALRGMAERLNNHAIRAFVALLVQSEALGVSVAQSLRTYSAEMREGRFLKAEEKAMRIPVLMTIPLVMCFMPVILVALLLPTAIDIVRTLVPAMINQGAPR